MPIPEDKRNEILNSLKNNSKLPSQSNRDYLNSLRNPQGVISETLGDIKETISGIKQDVEQRSEKIEDIEQAQKTGEQGLLRNIFQRIGQGAGAVSDVLGRAAIGVGKVILPEKGEQFVKEKVEGAVGKIAELEPVRNVLNKYEELKKTNPALARDIDAALGFGSLALDIAGLKTGKVLTDMTQKTGDVTTLLGKGVGKVTTPTARLGSKITGEIEGILTGTSYETLQQAFNASKLGGQQLDTFTKALRNQITPEQIADNLKQGIEFLDDAKKTAFSQAINEVGQNIVKTDQLLPNTINKLKQFNIDVVNGKLDFNNSVFRTIPQAKTKLQDMYEEVLRLGDSQTIKGIDTSRQALRNLAMTGDDASAKQANSIIYGTIDDVKRLGTDNSDVYKTALREFAEDADYLDELKTSLMAGDGKTIDQTFRRLTTSLKTNNEQRLNLLKELDEATDGAILSSVAGQQLSEVIPRSIFKYIAAGIVGGAAVTGGLSTSLLPTLLFASPRVVGEFVRGLGMAANKADIIIDAISQARKTLDLSGIKLPLGGITSQAVEQE